MVFQYKTALASGFIEYFNYTQKWKKVKFSRLCDAGKSTRFYIVNKELFVDNSVENQSKPPPWGEPRSPR